MRNVRARTSGERVTARQAVLDRHGKRCLCALDCGSEQHPEHPVTTDDGRRTCGRPDGGDVWLIAAPVRWMAESQAARTPVELLVPWCGPCWEAAGAKAKAARRAELAEQLAADQLSLFEPLEQA